MYLVLGMQVKMYLVLGMQVRQEGDGGHCWL